MNAAIRICCYRISSPRSTPGVSVVSVVGDPPFRARLQLRELMVPPEVREMMAAIAALPGRGITVLWVDM